MTIRIERKKEIKMEKNQKKKGILFQMAIICLTIFSITLADARTAVNAYVLNGYKMSQPENVKIYLGVYTSGYNIKKFAKKWQTCCPEIKIKEVSISGTANITYTGAPNIDNGTYGVTYPSNNNMHIAFYKSFYNASNIERKETIVHETGHALGLGHTQSKNNSNSVMRALGFNKIAKPLSDDIAGIAKLY